MSADENGAENCHVSLFAAGGDAATKTTSSIKDAVSDKDAIFVTSAQQPISYREQFTAFLYNPIVILFVWMYTLVTAVQKRVIQASDASPHMKAKVVADSTDTPIYRMERNIFPVVKNQGLVWTVPSWLYFIALVSTVIETVAVGTVVPFAITAAVTGLFAAGFLRTSRTERNLRRLREIRATIDKHDLDTVLLVASPAVVDQLEDILELGSLSYSRVSH